MKYFILTALLAMHRQMAIFVQGKIASRHKMHKFGIRQSDHSIEDLKVRGIEKIHNNSPQWRRERERDLLDFHTKISDTGRDELR